MSRSIIGVMVMTALNSIVKIDAEESGCQFTKFYPATGDCDVLNSYIYDMMHNRELIKSPFGTSAVVAYAPAQASPVPTAAHVTTAPVATVQPAPAQPAVVAPVVAPTVQSASVVPAQPVVVTPAQPPAVLMFDGVNTTDEMRAIVTAWLAEGCKLQPGQGLPTAVAAKINDIKAGLHGQPLLVNGQVIEHALAVKTWLISVCQQLLQAPVQNSI